MRGPRAPVGERKALMRTTLESCVRSYLHPRAPGGLKVHATHFAVREHLVPLHRIRLKKQLLVANVLDVTCTSEGRSSSMSSSPHPPTLSALAGGFRTVDRAAAAVPLPAAALAAAPAAGVPAAMDCHAGEDPEK
jgi:hypothetical protein